MKQTPPAFDEAFIRMHDENLNPCKIDATSDEIEDAPRDAVTDSIYIAFKLGKYGLAVGGAAHAAIVSAPLSTIFGIAALGYATGALVSAAIKKTEKDHINEMVAERITGNRKDGAKNSFNKIMLGELFDQRKIYNAIKPEPLVNKDGTFNPNYPRFRPKR